MPELAPMWSIGDGEFVTYLYLSFKDEELEN